MPQAPTNETGEYVEDTTFEDVPASLHLGNEPNIYLTPQQDMEDRGRVLHLFLQTTISIQYLTGILDDINDEKLDYLGDLDDG